MTVKPKRSAQATDDSDLASAAYTRVSDVVPVSALFPELAIAIDALEVRMARL